MQMTLLPHNAREHQRTGQRKLINWLIEWSEKKKTNKQAKTKNKPMNGTNEQTVAHFMYPRGFFPKGERGFTQLYESQLTDWV